MYVKNLTQWAEHSAVHLFTNHGMITVVVRDLEESCRWNVIMDQYQADCSGDVGGPCRDYKTSI